jgi:HEAT repeat protein
MEMRKKRLSKSFKTRISNDPMSVVELYSQPDDDDICEPLVRALEDPDKTAIKALVLNSLTSDECQKNAIELLLYFMKDEKRYVRLAASKTIRMIENLLGVWIDPVTGGHQDSGKTIGR